MSSILYKDLGYIKGIAGVNGLNGNPGTRGESGAMFSPRGDWQYGTSYIRSGEIIDLVEYEGMVYSCKKSNSGSLPPSVDTESWDLFRGGGKKTVYRFTIAANDWSEYEDSYIGDVYKVVVNFPRNSLKATDIVEMKMDAVKLGTYDIFIESHGVDNVVLYALNLPMESLTIDFIYANVVQNTVKQDVESNEIFFEIVPQDSRMALDAGIGTVDWGDGSISPSGEHIYQLIYDSPSEGSLAGSKTMFCLKYKTGIFSIRDLAYGSYTVGNYFKNIFIRFRNNALQNGFKMFDSYYMSERTDLKMVSLSGLETQIPEKAFYRTALVKIDLDKSAGISKIADDAFSNCSSLTDLTSDGENELSIGYIGNGAFSYCYNLSKITLNNLRSLGTDAFYESGLNTISISGNSLVMKDRAFANCTNLSSVSISGIAEIQESVFSKCTNLASITLPSGLRKIGSSAFSRCTSLTSINLPKSITQLGSSIFSGSAVETINYSGTVDEFNEIDTYYTWDGARSIIIHCTDGDIVI